MIHIVPVWEEDLHSLHGPCFCLPKVEPGMIVHEARSDRPIPPTEGWAVIRVPDPEPN